jgi:uncharacterized membrane protein YfcA
MLVVVGYCLALIMGITLGLIGAGGSILTVPILVYCMHIQPVTATGYSLLIVGLTALIGTWRYSVRHLVNYKSAAVFTVPAMVSVLLTRALLVPALPDSIHFAGFSISGDSLIMVLFAVLMFAAARFMLKKNISSDPAAAENGKSIRYARLISGSAAIGLLTGMVGAGGGFLIIPTLIGLFGLQVKEAVGTSLAIISVNSLVGFLGDLNRGIELNWSLLFVFLTLTTIGMWVGTSLSRKIDATQLRKLFGWFVLAVACAVFFDNFFLQ